MSYCRWSSDGWKSDVYTYADTGGTWTTHVAACRRTGLDTLPPDPYLMLGSEDISPEQFMKIYKEYHAVLDGLPFRAIDLPHAGETFRDATPQDCANTLKMLRATGYHVPAGVIEELENEIINENDLQIPTASEG